ncbi:MAG: hypothetical protein D6826_01035 [Alphaproteobacteria bacterium]|nr:MAG: hypothetical protein D6826_01035 [Alphaproteobacteria bacterium]
MQWSQQMSVGIPEIDDDHKQLIRVINRLEADANDETRLHALRQSLRGLQRYAEFHFAREERVMAACDYPGLDEHKTEHRDFVARIAELNRRLAENPDHATSEVNDALLSFLKDWLTHHILIEDKAYQPYAEESPAAREAAKSFQAAEIWWGQ